MNPSTTTNPPYGPTETVTIWMSFVNWSFCQTTADWTVSSLVLGSEESEGSVKSTRSFVPSSMLIETLMGNGHRGDKYETAIPVNVKVATALATSLTVCDPL